MVRVLVGLFVVAHGMVTGAIWVTPRRAGAPFDATHSWLLGDARWVAATGGVLVAIGFAVTGIGLLTQNDWWAPWGVGAGILSLALMVVYFNPWLLAGIAISILIAAAGLRSQLAA
jgi:hypothetical protein